MKKLISALLACVTLSALPLSAGATFSPLPGAAAPSVGVITPFFANIAETSASIAISTKGVATVMSYVTGTQGVTTGTNISAELQQYKNGSWVTIKTFTASSSSYRLSLSETYTVSKGYSYRVRSTLTVTYGAKTESYTATTPSTSY